MEVTPLPTPPHSPFTAFRKQIQEQIEVCKVGVILGLLDTPTPSLHRLNPSSDPNPWHPQAIAFIHTCLKKDPNAREPCHRLLQHDFVTSATFSKWH